MATPAYINLPHFGGQGKGQGQDSRTAGPAGTPSEGHGHTQLLDAGDTLAESSPVTSPLTNASCTPSRAFQSSQESWY